MLDTNVLLVAISPRSPYHWIWKALLAKKYDLYVTSDILDEYAEIIERQMGHLAAAATLDLLMELPNVHFVQKYYHWQLIEADPDDNKFLDCAIAASVEYLVSHDAHFKVINEYDYLNIKLIAVEGLKLMLN